MVKGLFPLIISIFEQIFVMILSLSEEELDRVGNANGKNISVRSLVYILAGHIIHHTNVIKERYL